MNQKYEEIKAGVEKLYQRNYIYNYREWTDSDTRTRYMKIEFGTHTTSGSKGGYATPNRLKKECQKRNIFYIDNTTYNYMNIYEEDPLDVFPIFEGDDRNE